MARKHVLVTGGLGHIGSRLIRDLSENNEVSKITILDNLSTDRYCSLMNLPNNIKYRFIKGDIRKEDDIEKSLDGVDTVIHLAAITNAPETIKKPKLTKEVNYDAVKNLLNICESFGVDRFFFPSTTSVYGPAEGVVVEDYKNYDPLTPYAKYKLKAENEVISYNGDMKTCVARFGTIYGHSIGMRFHTAVNKFIFQSVVLKSPLTVWQDALDQKRPYLDIEDASKFVSFFMNIDNTDFFGDTYNILTDNATVKQVINIIKKYTNGFEIKMTKSPIINQASYEVSRCKIEKWGFEFKGNMDRGIKETIEKLNSFID